MHHDMGGDALNSQHVFLLMLKELFLCIFDYHFIRKWLKSFPLFEKELLDSWGGGRDDTIPNSISLLCVEERTPKKNQFLSHKDDFLMTFITLCPHISCS
jgi:hypothetical protein